MWVYVELARGRHHTKGAGKASEEFKGMGSNCFKLTLVQNFEEVVVAAAGGRIPDSRPWEWQAERRVKGWVAEPVPKLAFASESDVGIPHNHCSGSEDSSGQVQELPVRRFIPTTLLQPQKKLERNLSKHCC